MGMGVGAVAGSTTSVTCVSIRRWSEGKEVQTFELLFAGCTGAATGISAGTAGAHAAGLDLSNLARVEVVDKSCKPRNLCSCTEQQGGLTIHACDEALHGRAPFQRLLKE